jgi:hypothetical protein
MFCSLLAVIFLLITPSFMLANVGIPTIAIIWPFFWLAFIPVIFIETVAMRRAFSQYPFGKLLFFNLVSNAASTFVGIPLAYALFYMISIFAYNNFPLEARESLTNTIWSYMFAYGGFSWEFCVAIALLLIVFFVISVFVERWVFSKMVDREFDKQLLTKEVIKANVASYLFLVIILICTAIKFT